MQRFYAKILCMSEPTIVRLTPQSIKVLAHPMRSRLLISLRTNGPATATSLAAELATNTGATSYHLRQLEAVGLIEDDGTGRGRRRVWRASTDLTSWYPSDFEGDDDATTALDWLTRDYLRHFTEQLERWYDAAPTWPAPWQDSCGSSDEMVLVSADDLASMRDEIGAVIARYRRRGQGNPRAKRVATYSFCYPIDLHNVPT